MRKMMAATWCRSGGRPAEDIPMMSEVSDATRLRGRSSPLGATVFPDGVNFSVFSRDAADVELLLFDRVDDAGPSRTVTLDPRQNRTYHYWHVFVPGIGPGQL
jgi:glycogen operon protein